MAREYPMSRGSKYPETASHAIPLLTKGIPSFALSEKRSESETELDKLVRTKIWSLRSHSPVYTDPDIRREGHGQTDTHRITIDSGNDKLATS